MSWRSCINKLSEVEVVKVWRQLSRNQSELVTEDGEVIRIVYPGRPNDSYGADFCDAVIATSRGLMRGHIEIHVKASDWQAHQHHLNPSYEDVVLHVVMWNNTSAVRYCHSCRPVPALSLDKFLKSPREPFTATFPCQKVRDRDFITALLDEAGDERFYSRAVRFKTELVKKEAGQVLYEGIMEALGYAKNKLPCLELARRLPLRILESMANESWPYEDRLASQQALLLGAAGLLPSQRPGFSRGNPGNYTKKLEGLWAATGGIEPLPFHAWNFFKVRPGNFPVRRLAAVSYLILLHQEKGILSGLINLVNNAAIGSPCRLRIALEIRAEGYWAEYLDFGLRCRRSIPLIGTSRADEIIINVVLPFAFAWGKLNCPGLPEKALGFYRNYAKTASNTIEKHMRNQFSLDSGLINSARRQQGLLHIYKSYCLQAKCAACRLN